jgi:hypothetical protein
MTIFGWDASDFDHDRGMRATHIENAAIEGIRFFTHKVTEGTRTVHFQCGSKLKTAVAVGIPFVGAYVVTRTPGNFGNGTISAQVNFAITELTRQWPTWKDFFGFFWQVDLEHWSYDTVAAKYGVEMCSLLRERTGKRVLLYAPRWAYGDSIPGNDPLWNSHYVSTTGPFRSIYPGDGYVGWNRMSERIPVILQYSSKAIIGGQSTCDANAFRGSLSDFETMIGVEMALTGDDVRRIWRDGSLVAVPDLTTIGATRTEADKEAEPEWSPGTFLREIYENIARARSETRALPKALLDPLVGAVVTKLGPLPTAEQIAREIIAQLHNE